MQSIEVRSEFDTRLLSPNITMCSEEREFARGRHDAGGCVACHGLTMLPIVVLCENLLRLSQALTRGCR